MNYTLVISQEEDEAIRQALIEPLRKHNVAKAGPGHYLPLVVSLVDTTGAVRGGAWGYTAYGWMFIQLLVVPEEHRGAGLGTRIMAAAEAEALARGCRDAWLDTHEFQAKGFYEKLGYEKFGELQDYPPPFARYFFKKKLVDTNAASD
jgi:GNAT superfamily N-acetyltransferase